jgi:class 3 adenylate cyclase
MSIEISRLEQAIAALESQRATLGNSVVDVALVTLREKLVTLHASSQEAVDESQKRQIITLLFADLPDLAVLGERYDPEDMRDAVNALWDQLDSVILGHGGQIDKHMGHGVMVLWGSESIAEDDPEQAIRAALGMKNILREACQASTIFASENISLRAGINTGPTMIGQMGTTGEFTAIGGTVHLAARLNQSAEAGQILISTDTCRLVRDIFDIKKMPAMRMTHLRGLLNDHRQLRQQALFYLTRFFQSICLQSLALMMLEKHYQQAFSLAISVES